MTHTTEDFETKVGGANAGWTCNNPVETRKMSWDDEGSLFNELYWLSEGKFPYDEATPEERQEAYRLCDQYIGDTHEEPDTEICEVHENDMEAYDACMEEESQVSIAWLKTDWEICDRLLAGVELVAGYKFPGEFRWNVNPLPTPCVVGSYEYNQAERNN